MMFFIVGQ